MGEYDEKTGADTDGTERESGTVKWFDEVRGYGFLGRDGAVDVFVHGSAVEAGGALTVGEPVSFEVVEGKRGLQARAVRRQAC